MKDVVKYLREGWYCNGKKFVFGYPFRNSQVDCCKMWDKFLHSMGTIFVGICGGLYGMIGDLIIDENWEDERVDVPIDTLVVNLTEEVGGDEISFELTAL